MGMGTELKLQIRNLAVRYGDETAVESLDLELEEGEILTLVGPTGCGKSTTLRAVAGLERPDSGEIYIDGRTVAGGRFVPPERRGVGLVFQDFALFPHMTVEENVGFRLDDERPVDRWLRLLDIEEQRGKTPNCLSGGQKQRVALARSLAHDPAIVLLDEPLSNLDAALKDRLKWEIRDALKEAGVAAIWVTHDQKEALSVGDRVGVMRDGQLEQLGTPEACFQEPSSRFVAEFLGDASFVPGEAGDGLVTTPIGTVRSRIDTGYNRVVEVMVRPDDLDVARADGGNGTVTCKRFEGGTMLYGVELLSGEMVRVRVNHEVDVDVGESVEVRVSTGHPFTCFSSGEMKERLVKQLVERTEQSSVNQTAEGMSDARPVHWARTMPGESYRMSSSSQE